MYFHTIPFSFDYLFQPQTYIQFGLIGVSVLISVFISRPLAKQFKKAPFKSERIRKLVSYLPFYSFALMLTLAISLSLYQATTELEPTFFRGALIVAFSMALIKVIRPTIKNPFYATAFTCTTWIITFLNLTGLFKTTLTELDRVGLEMGKVRISVLILLKCVIALILCSRLSLFFSKALDRYLTKQATIQPSTRILFSKLTKIALLGFSFLIGFSLVGIDLSIFAFFVGALGIAVGLGVQNICSNLFSGIILLLDKSIKPGDVISLDTDKVYGVVHKLNARYVSIRTREGKEHLIPNDFFISSKTINWSHSDSLIRIPIEFVVSYNSDLELVKKLILEVAHKTKRVLNTPTPAVRFTAIKENAVHIQLRVWLDDPHMGKSGIRSDIIFNVWKKFREKGVQVPYSPRELHFANALSTNTISSNLSTPYHSSTPS